MNTYFAKVSAWITCGFCEEKQIVTNAEELDCPADQIDDWGYYIEAAIEEKKEADGKTLTHEPKPLPKQPADVSMRKHVRIIRKGCSGFNHGSFLNR